MEAFRKLGLQKELVQVLVEAGFKEPTDIQAKTIPLTLEGKDVIGGAATGSGKTLAFGACMIEKIKHGLGVQSLILTPTRELAEQVSRELEKFSKYTHLEVTAVYGGVGIEPQIRNLRHADIVVGTPGRILDHLERRTLDLRKVSILVLDEADRMLDMGFIDDVEKIIKNCPKHRQTLMFSATVSPDIKHLANSYMNNPEYVSVEQYIDASKLKQTYYDVPKDQKFSLLVHLLKHEHPGLIMVFCNTQRTTDFVANLLSKQGMDAIAIHGGLSQAKRTKVMEHFKSNKIAVLVCTDVAARGLDIKGVSHIYNYDVPMNSKEYIHRIGRTARAGKEGMAITLVSTRDYDNFRAVLRNQELQIKAEEMPQVENIPVQFRSDRGSRGGGFRGRGGESSGRRFGGRGEGRGYSSGRSFGSHNSARSFGRSRSESGSSSGRRSFGSGQRRSLGSRSGGQRRSFSRRY